MESILNDNLQYIYLQEDFKKFTKDKVLSFFNSIISKDVNKIEKLKYITPEVSYNNIITHAKKSEILYKNIKELDKKIKPSNLKDVEVITTATLLTIKATRKKKDNILDKIITTLSNFFQKYGKLVLTAAVLVKIISFLGKYFWELHHQIPELRDIFNSAKFLNQYSIYGIIAGVIMLLISFLLNLFYKKRKDENNYQDKGSNPYEDF